MTCPRVWAEIRLPSGLKSVARYRKEPNHRHLCWCPLKHNTYLLALAQWRRRVGPIGLFLVHSWETKWNSSYEQSSCETFHNGRVRPNMYTSKQFLNACGCSSKTFVPYLYRRNTRLSSSKEAKSTYLQIHPFFQSWIIPSHQSMHAKRGLCPINHNAIPFPYNLFPDFL